MRIGWGERVASIGSAACLVVYGYIYGLAAVILYALTSMDDPQRPPLYEGLIRYLAIAELVLPVVAGGALLSSRWWCWLAALVLVGQAAGVQWFTRQPSADFDLIDMSGWPLRIVGYLLPLVGLVCLAGQLWADHRRRAALEPILSTDLEQVTP